MIFVALKKLLSVVFPAVTNIVRISNFSGLSYVSNLFVGVVVVVVAFFRRC